MTQFNPDTKPAITISKRCEERIRASITDSSQMAARMQPGAVRDQTNAHVAKLKALLERVTVVEWLPVAGEIASSSAVMEFMRNFKSTQRVAG